MSRIGSKAIALPSGVTIEVTGSSVTLKGPKGQHSWELPQKISVLVEGNTISVKRNGDGRQERALHGLARALLANMVQGVSKGFERRLEIIGVGYKAQAKGVSVALNLGHSHPIDYKSPAGVTVVNDPENKQILIISGVDRQLVGQVAAEIRSFRPPEPYQGKGVRYVGEYVRRKVGKSAAKGVAAA